MAGLEKLLRTAIFKPAAQLVGQLLQEAADRIDAAYQPKPGEVRKGRYPLKIQGIFGFFPLRRDYYYHPGKKQGHHPADAVLGLEVSHTRRFARRRYHWRKLLLADGVERIIQWARKEALGTPRQDSVEARLGYFVHNVERMRYGTFSKQGLFIGSGVIEAGCRSVIGSRCKQSGMFWTEEGANSVMALRCLNAGGRLNAFWQARHASRAARAA